MHVFKIQINCLPFNDHQTDSRLLKATIEVKSGTQLILQLSCVKTSITQTEHLHVKPTVVDKLDWQICISSMHYYFIDQMLEDRFLWTQ